MQFIAQPTAPLRYAILHHTDIPQPHFDLFFETIPGSPLITWRSFIWPIINSTPLERLPDHRRDYLEYEGPVSNNRGRVRRVAAGTFQIESTGENHFQITADTGLRISIRRQGDTTTWLAEVGQTA